MNRKILIFGIIGGLLISLLMFQLFFRYEIVEIGVIDLKYDRLAKKIYYRAIERSNDEPQVWREYTTTNNFRLAKAQWFKRQIRVFGADLQDVESRIDNLENRIDDIGR